MANGLKSSQSESRRWCGIGTFEQAWRWGAWEYGEANLGSGYMRADVGIDAVAMRRSDGKYIAIQCKSRMVDGDGRGNPISKDESDSFASASASEFWEESWIVSNCDVGLGSRAAQTASMRGKPVKILNVARDLERERESWASKDDCCVHCENPDDPNADPVQDPACRMTPSPRASASCANTRVRTAAASPRGEARGRIILPCGTGKTRISLRIVEELTPPGGGVRRSLPVHRARGADTARVSAIRRRARGRPRRLLRPDRRLRPEERGRPQPHARPDRRQRQRQRQRNQGARHHRRRRDSRMDAPARARRRRRRSRFSLARIRAASGCRRRC